MTQQNLESFSKFSICINYSANSSCNILDLSSMNCSLLLMWNSPKCTFGRETGGHSSHLLVYCPSIHCGYNLARLELGSRFLVSGADIQRIMLSPLLSRLFLFRIQMQDLAVEIVPRASMRVTGKMKLIKNSSLHFLKYTCKYFLSEMSRNTLM